jgi:DNA-binding SARP family transcriptional activator
MNILRVYAFGRLRVCYAEGEVQRFPTRQAESLFGYLALRAGADHPREVLIDQVLGGYSDPKSARARLSTALWRVRRTLSAAGAPVDDYLFAERDTIGLSGGATLWLDMKAFLDGLKAATSADDQEQALARAVALYQSDFCEGLYHDWCLAERERLERLLLRALGQMMAACGARGAFEEAIALGSRILARDPLREEIHRALMVFHYQMGNRAAAVRQYARCRDLLQAELAVEPMPATHALYLQINAGQVAAQQETTPPRLQEVLAHLRETIGGMERMTGQLGLAVGFLERLAAGEGKNATRGSPEV